MEAHKCIKRQAASRNDYWGNQKLITDPVKPSHPQLHRTVFYHERKKCKGISDHRKVYTTHICCAKSSTKTLIYQVLQLKLYKMLQALAIDSPVTVETVAMEQKVLKPDWKSGKRSHLSKRWMSLPIETFKRSY